MSGLAFEGLRVRLGARQVLDGVSAALRPGEVTAIVGPNGAGKSTLLECLAGLRRPDAGEVRLDERSLLLGWPARERAQRIAYLPQTPEIAWSVDVRTFVGLGRIPYVGAWGLGDQDRAAVDAALEAAGMTGFAGRIVQTLSGGERARALIARALAGEPKWLLADEPFAGLDPGHALDAIALFARLAREKDLGVVTTLHDLDATLRLSTTVILLHGGRVLANGAATEVLVPDKLRTAYGVETVLHEGEAGPRLEIVSRTRS